MDHYEVMNATGTLFGWDDPAPDLDAFNVILVNTSAGKDSLVMVHEIHRLLGNDPRIVAVHADLGRMEWPGVRELAERQVARYGWRMEVVRKDGPDLLGAIEARGMWPSAAARYCTSDFKRAPIRKLMTALAAEHREARRSGPCRILNCMGFRAEESSARAKRPMLARDDSASNGRREVVQWLPVFRWTEDEVWATIRAHGLEYHPAYDLPGVSRLSCVFCVLAGERQLRAGAEAMPELHAEYVSVEIRTGHQFKHGWSIESAGSAPIVRAS